MQRKLQTYLRGLARKMLGSQYDGNRNIYSALGYPETIEWKEYWNQYERQDIANAIINRPIDQTWRGPLILQELKKEESEFARAWKELEWNLRIKNKFVRVDKLSGIGRYAVLFCGFNDVDGDKITTETEVVATDNLKLVYLTPYSEDAAKIMTWEKDHTNPRFGMPLTYQINASTENGAFTKTLKVHYSRILHITGETLTSEVYGIPTLQKVFNRLMDLEKLVGASAEMFWRGARPGYSANIDPEYSQPDGFDNTMEEKLEDYENDLRRILTLEGVDMKALETQIEDPSNHISAQITMISVATGIPKRILEGSERGELASSQDVDSWHSIIQVRRDEFAENEIIGKFVDRMIVLGILPVITAWEVLWTPLAVPSEKERAEVGKVRATALKEYFSNPAAQEAIPPESFMKFFLGFSDSEIEIINANIEEILAGESEIDKILKEAEEIEKENEE